MAFVDLRKHPAGRKENKESKLFVFFAPTPYKLKKGNGVFGWNLVMRISKSVAMQLDIKDGDHISLEYNEEYPREWRIQKSKEGERGYRVLKKCFSYLEIRFRWRLYIPNQKDIEGYNPTYFIENKVLHLSPNPITIIP